MRACLDSLCIVFAFSFKYITTTHVLLGNGYFQQFCILGCILPQIILTLLLFLLYRDDLNGNYIWWPTVELVRICMLGVLRVARLFLNEANIFSLNGINDAVLYKAIALLNVIGFIWSFPIWIIYVSVSLTNDEASIAFIAITLIFIALHILSSIPSITRIIRLSSIKRRQTQINNDHQVNCSFLAEWHDGARFDDHSDDPVLQTDPMMIVAEDVDYAPITYEPLKSPTEDADVENPKDECILMRFTFPNQSVCSHQFIINDDVSNLYRFIDGELSQEMRHKLDFRYGIVCVFPGYSFDDHDLKLCDIASIMGSSDGTSMIVSPMLHIQIIKDFTETSEDRI